LLGIRITRLFVSIPQLAQCRNQTVQQAADAGHRPTLQRKKPTGGRGNSLVCRCFSAGRSACYRSREDSGYFWQLKAELTANRQGSLSPRCQKIEAGATPPKGGAQWDIAASAVLPA
jgi:hypothetical protein